MKPLRLLAGLLGKFIRASRRIRWKLLRLVRETVTVSTQQGVFTLPLDRDDPIGRSLYVRRSYELELMTGATRFLRSEGMIPSRGSGTLLDIGANNGVTSIGFLHLGEFQRAIAIEPEPGNQQLLERNLELNNLIEEVIRIPVALSNDTRVVDFELSRTNRGDHRVRSQRAPQKAEEHFDEAKREVIQVQADTLDNVLREIPKGFKEEIALLWVDVQGHEGRVFEGGVETLSKGCPVVTEIWPYAMLRAGVTAVDFMHIASRFWSSYWTRTNDTFLSHRIDTLHVYFDELGDRRSGNVIFTK